MTKFWFMTYSTTAALGWVALGSTGAQAVDSLASEEMAGDAPLLAQGNGQPAMAAQPHPLDNTVIVEVEPTPSVEFSPTTPPGAYQAPVTRTLPHPEVNGLTASGSPSAAVEALPPSHHSPPLEADPAIQAAINPQTPAQRAALRTVPPESLIRDGRSFGELIAPSTPQNRQKTLGAPEQIPHRLTQAPTAPPAANPVLEPAIAPSQRRNTAPLLEKLEEDLQHIRHEITGSIRPLALDSPLISLTPLPDLSAYRYFRDRHPSAPQNSPAWQAVSISREFALSEFEATTSTFNLARLQTNGLAINFMDLGSQFLGDRLLSNTFLGNAQFFDLNRAAVTFTELAAAFTSRFTDWEPLLAAETDVAVVDLAPTTEFFKMTSAAMDYFTQYNPANPLTFGLSHFAVAVR